MSNIHTVLTDREVEVLRLAASGKKDRQVAHVLKVSTSTVTTYWYRIKMKLMVRSRSEAIALFASQNAGSQEPGEGDHISARIFGSRQWSELQAPFVIFHLDSEGRFTRGSGATHKYVGDQGKPPTNSEWDAFVQAAIGTEGLRRLDATGFYRKQVRICGFAFDVFAISDRGQPGGGRPVSAVAIDITNHLQRIGHLQKELDYFKSLLELSPNMYFVWDFKEGCITYANRFALHVLGHGADRLRSLGWSVFDLVHPDDRGRVMARISQIAHMRPGDIQTLAVRVKTLEGDYVSWNTVATPLSLNQDGSVREFLCACFDIASYHEELDRLKVEHQDLLDRYEKLAQSFKHTPVGLMTVDPSGRVLSANPEGLRILQADGDGWLDTYDPPPAGERSHLLRLDEDWMRAIVAPRRPTAFQVAELHDYLGNCRPFVLSAWPLRNSLGVVVCYSVTFFNHAETALADRSLDAHAREGLRPSASEPLR